MKELEFGSKDVADSVREEYEEYLCPDDDRRLKTVRFVDDVPDRVWTEVTARAGSSRDERGGPGQTELTDGEKDRIDFSKEGANVPKARAVKAIARDEGVDDWTSYFDPTLTVDEHRGVMAEAKRDEQGQRRDAHEADQDDIDEKLAQAEKAMGQQCDHARGHCENGDPEACEFLQEHCGLSEDQVSEILSDEQGDPERGDLPGKAYGALYQLWNQYRAGLGNAKEAAAGINEIRDQYGQDPLAFDELGERPITQSDIES